MLAESEEQDEIQSLLTPVEQALRDRQHVLERLTEENQALQLQIDSLQTALQERHEVPHRRIVDEKLGEERINPYFSSSGQEVRHHQVGVLMPFGESWSNRIWYNHLKPIVEELNIDPPPTCIRASDFHGHDVLHDIYHMIETSHAIVADITKHNPNVFYELGIAHSLGKPVILLTQSVDYIPVDLQRFRFIIYEDNSDGYKLLKTGLEGALLEVFA